MRVPAAAPAALAAVALTGVALGVVGAARGADPQLPLQDARPLVPLPAIAPSLDLAPLPAIGPSEPLAAMPALEERGRRAIEARRVAWQRSFDAAVRYAANRLGRVSVALVDDQGTVHGWHATWRYHSASLVKAMLLVARLRQIGDAPLPEADRKLLTPMIESSDNDAASAVFGIVGEPGLAFLAQQVGMRHFVTSPTWGNTQITAEDQARFFSGIDTLVPPRHRAFARSLLAGIVAGQRWGIAAATPAGARIFFKGGWRPEGDGWIVHQAALVESGGRRVSLAVLTDGDRSDGYGHETIRAVASRLLPLLR